MRQVDIYCLVKECQGWLCSNLMTNSEINEFNHEYQGIMIAKVH